MEKSVYQVFNVSRSEAYVGITMGVALERVASFCSKPPSALAHWDFGEDKIRVSSIEIFIDDQDALVFYAGLVDSIKGSPFKSLSFEIEPIL